MTAGEAAETRHESPRLWRQGKETGWATAAHGGTLGPSYELLAGFVQEAKHATLIARGSDKQTHACCLV
jgi:hypothetical protein